jgi:phosphoglycolate phosphatase-like HAD superfamily hydrolase
VHAFEALPAAERSDRLAAARAALREAGADLVIDSVADLLPALEAKSHS